MNSWSYCKALDVCVNNIANYIDYKCASKWVKGQKLALDECNPTNGTCQNFTSSAAAYGVWTNTTTTLATTEECTIQVDASAAVARVVFTEGTNLAIVGQDKYVQGDTITVAAGGKQTFTVYNADISGGSVSFQLCFTEAVMGMAKGLAVIAIGAGFVMLT